MKAMICVINQKNLFIGKALATIDVEKSEKEFLRELHKVLSGQFPGVKLTIQIKDKSQIVIDDVAVGPASGFVNGIIDQVVSQGTWLVYKN